jgi:hypothetical protein
MAASALQRRAFITVGGETTLNGSERYEKILETLTEWTEGIVEEKIARYKLDVIDDIEWGALISDKAVIADVLQEQHERRLSGASTQALARTFCAKGPRLLDTIVNDVTQPARARIDALRELRMQSGFATTEDGLPGGQKFSLVINIGDGAPRVINVTPGPHNLTPGVTRGPTIDAGAVYSTPPASPDGYDALSAPPYALGAASRSFLDEVGAGLEDPAQ